LPRFVVVAARLLYLAYVADDNTRRPPTNGGHWVLGTVIALACGVIVAAIRFRPPPPFAKSLIVATSIMASAIMLAVAADERTRLSRAIVETKDRTCVEGPLVASTERGFYLANGRDHAIALVPQDEVVRSVIQRPKLVVADSLIITGACPSDVPGH
jgi:hypothetical protein